MAEQADISRISELVNNPQVAELLGLLREKKATDKDKADTGGGDVLERLKGLDAGVSLGADGVKGFNRSAPSSTSSVSWADEVEEQVRVGAPVRSGGVRGSGAPLVTFGGFVVGEAASVMQSQTGSPGGMSQYVKTPAMRGLRRQLDNWGIKLPKAAMWELAIVTYTAATMPTFFSRGKQKLRTIAAIGDSALSCAAIAGCHRRGEDVESAQRVRSTTLTDGHMARVFVRSPLKNFVSFGAAVDPMTSKTGATALEAIAGVIALWRTPADLTRFAVTVGLIIDDDQ